MTARSVFVRIVTLGRLLFSRRAREEFARATTALEAANIEVSARLARLAAEDAAHGPGRPPLTPVKSDTSKGEPPAP